MTILGIDEVGRGPWAGPLVVGAVILPDNRPSWIDELTDSKKLTTKKRESLSEIILEEAPATGLGWVSSKEIDEVGLSAALKLATRRAVHIIQQTTTPFNEIIIDGTVNFLQDTMLAKNVTVLKKADYLIKEVSAASIIAKVARDHYMYELAKRYPEYGFDKHVGYGTAFHKKAIETFGVCVEHRMSFKPIASLSNTTKNGSNNRMDTKSIGNHAEKVVADYLVSRGHRIIARNNKTKYYEIDIISTYKNKLFFTEVKYRKTSTHGTPLEAITPEKLKQMTFAANSFLRFHPEYNNYQPTLAAAAVSGDNYKIQYWSAIQ